MTFTASFPTLPENMSLKARLAYIYFFGDGKSYFGGWACVRTAEGVWIITDEACDLSSASVYPDDDSFVAWLETVVEDHLGDDRIGFLQNFCHVRELINDEVARAMEKLINIDR